MRRVLIEWAFSLIAVLPLSLMAGYLGLSFGHTMAFAASAIWWHVISRLQEKVVT